MAMSQIVEHIALFKVKDGVDSSKIDTMVKGLSNLGTIDGVLYLSAGPIHRLRSASAFTHFLHSRYRTKEDLDTYIAHPTHLRVVEDNISIWDDVMAVDWIADHVPGVLTPPPGSTAKTTLLKVKENLTEEAKTKVLEAVKDKSPGIDQITVGENFSPVRANGFSIASVAYFKDLGEVEAHKESVKEKVGDYLDDTIVVEFVVPS